MKIKPVLILLFFYWICGCTYPKYLSPSDKININVHGSEIKLHTNRHPQKNISGELIAVDTGQIILLNDSKKVQIVSRSEILSFKLRYAAPKKYGWSIPLFVIAAFAEGVYAAITLPLNLIVTISVVSTSHSAFQYSNKEILYSDLKMFARFPQGLPKNVDLQKLR